MKNSFTAIDIGTNKVCGVVGYINPHGELHVSACHSEIARGVQEGVIVDMDSTTRAIRKVIDSLEFKISSCIEETYVAISGRKLNIYQKEVTHIRPNAYQEITKEELNSYTEELSKVNIPHSEVIVEIIPMVYNLDNNTVNTNLPLGLDCKELRGTYKIVTCEEHAYRHLERCLQKANLKIKGRVLSAEAAGWACLSQSERKAGAVVVDLGSGMTDISFFNKGMLVDVQVLPIGGEIITSDISEGCKILPENAERLKVRYGCAMVREEQHGIRVSVEGFNPNEVREISAFNLAQIINARLDEISTVVDEVVTASGLRSDLIAGMVLTGGTSLMNFVVEHFEEKTGMSVRCNQKQNQLQYKAATPELSKQLDARYTVALGTLIKVVNDVKLEKVETEHLEPLKPIEEVVSEDEAPKSESKVQELAGEPEKMSFFERLWHSFVSVADNSDDE